MLNASALMCYRRHLFIVLQCTEYTYKIKSAVPTQIEDEIEKYTIIMAHGTKQIPKKHVGGPGRG